MYPTNKYEEDNLIEFKFKAITAHEGHLQKYHPNYNGSRCNLRIDWDNREITNEYLSIIIADDLVPYTMDAKDKILLDTLE